MMNFFLLILYTVGAWLVHVALFSIYSKWFKSTKSLVFRLAHALEIGITVAIMLTMYNRDVSGIGILATVLGTLLVVDGVLYTTNKKLRHKFDLFHFVIAYAVVAAVVLLSK